MTERPQRECAFGLVKHHVVGLEPPRSADPTLIAGISMLIENQFRKRSAHESPPRFERFLPADDRSLELAGLDGGGDGATGFAVVPVPEAEVSPDDPPAAPSELFAAAGSGAT